MGQLLQTIVSYLVFGVATVSRRSCTDREACLAMSRPREPDFGAGDRRSATSSSSVSLASIESS